MCQVTPFTFPCCRRIYVSVERLPSCPDGWPRKKCPKELIVQISGYEPKGVQHRNQGICWRCVADRQGKDARQRESLRPVLDKAFIVEGLEEWNIEERRVKIEKAGLCWHCGADRGCESCGSGKVKVEEESAKAGNKRGRGEADVKGKGVNKKLKIEYRGSTPATPSMGSTPVVEQQQMLDPILQQYDYNHYSSGSCGVQSSYQQSTQSAPNLNYQPQQVQFQAPPAPMLQHEPESWQDPQGCENWGQYGQNLGIGQIDPSLYQLQGEQQAQQNLNLQLRHDEQLPPISQCRQNAVDLNAYNDETINRHFSDYDEGVRTKDEVDEKRCLPLTPAASQIDHSLESSPYQYPALT